MEMLFEGRDFTAWMPDIKSDKDEPSYAHIRITRKDKFKFKKSIAVFYTEDKGRYLFVPEKSAGISDSEVRDVSQALSEKHDILEEEWKKTNGEIVFK